MVCDISVFFSLKKIFFSLLNLYQLTSWRQTLKSWLLTRDSMIKLQILDQDILSTFMNHDEVRFTDESNVAG